MNGQTIIGSSQAAGDEGDPGVVGEQLSFGDTRLDLEFDGSKRTARVQDHEIALESANVILVDDVDGPTGPQIAGFLQVDALFRDEPAEIEVIIRRNPELYSFLRCDAKLPDANAQSMIDSICERSGEMPRPDGEMPRPEGVGFSQRSGPVSPAVVATWILRKQPRGSSELQLLVLWRGTPGWFMRGPNGYTHSGSGQGSVDESGPGVVVEHHSFGGTRLDLEFDPSNRAVRIQDHEIALGSANVILVDDVDGETGSKIAGSLQVDALFRDEPAEIEVIIRRNPELYSFLRCDAKLPDANAQRTFDSRCARMKAK